MNLLIGPKAKTAAEVAAEREAELDRDIQRTEIEHQKRLATVGVIEADLTKAEALRRGLEARRDSLANPDPAGLDRRIADALAREQELRLALVEIRDKLLSTPVLLAQLEQERRAAELDKISAERQECLAIARHAMAELLELEQAARQMLALKNRVLAAYAREAALCGSPPLFNTAALQSAPTLFPGGEPFFGRGLEEFLSFVEANRALGQR